MLLVIIITLAALFFSAFFSASETAVFSIPREKYEHLKNDKGSGYKIYEILMKSNLFLVFLLLGNNFVNIVAITGLTKILTVYLHNNLPLIFISTTAALLIFGEIMPKTIAIGNSMFIARFIAYPFAFALKYTDGFLKAVNSFNMYILRANYRYLLQSPNPFVTNEEYMIAVNEAVSAKKITSSTGEMVTSFLDLSEDSILQIARNRNSLKIIEKKDEKEQISSDEIAVSYGKSGNVNKVFYCSFNRIVKENAPVWFPTTKTIGDLHEYFLKNGKICVLLVDEYGDFFGAVCKYDIYKYWQAFCRHGKKHSRLNEITADGNSDVVLFQDWFSAYLLERYSDAKTLNGILCAYLGKIPRTGDTFGENGFVYHIIDADKTKINKIRIEKNDYYLSEL